MGAPGDENSPEDDAEDNAKIVDVLQSQYPTIFAKIQKQIEAEDQGSESDQSDQGDMGKMGDMASMMQ
jgi:hypothetical protein